MKTNRVTISTLLKALLVFTLLFTLFQACKKDDGTPTVQVDKTKLKARLDSANALYGGAVEGSAIGKYLAGSKATYKSSVDAATTVYNDANTTQTAVNNAYVNLGVATTTFMGQQVQQVAPQSLVLYYTFVDGSLTDLSGKNNSGTLKAGSTGITGTTSWTGWGGGTPTIAADRFGTAKSAYFFDKGANIEVPYSPSLNPGKEITISLWENATASRPSNYLVSLNRWNGYKLQLQEANKAFFTMKTNNANTIYDRDDETVTLDLNKWHHVAVTYKSGEMNFYIDGTLVKSWTNVMGDPAAVKNTINLVIGQDLPTSLYQFNDKNDADGNNFHGPWGGYFTGYMDDIRIYNAVLTPAQISSIYAAEKSQ